MARQSRLLGTVGQWAALVLCGALGIALFVFVDLTPEVEINFFFSSDDPQLRSSMRIDQQFGYSPQVFVAARSRQIVSGQYLGRLYQLTEELRAVPGVADVRSLTHRTDDPTKVLRDDPKEVFADLGKSPFWRRLLLAPDRSATFVVIRLRGDEHTATVKAIDEVLARNSRPDFDVAASGVPYVAEHLRKRLVSDLQRFSVVAFAAFATLVAILFRSVAILIGTMVAALTASFGTFLVRALAGMKTDVLVPNLWTIAFVLTISHVVYLTAEWRHAAREVGSQRAVRQAVRLVSPASAWSLLANLLGFASLIFVSAKPLRQFGISGVIAAALAMACAYGLYPAFLRAAKPGPTHAGPITRGIERFFTVRHRLVAAATVATALALAPFAWRVDTDPSLPSYFAAGDTLRAGLEAIDRSGGSSPLDLVVADAQGRPLDTDEAFQRLQTLHRGLERHPDVGVVLSPAALMGEVDRKWYSFLIPWDTALERLERPQYGRVARTFLTDDRQRGRFILRMHEGERSRPRADVIAEIRDIVGRHGFRPVEVGGLYALQGELSKLVEGSVVRGLGGLLVCFFIIVLIVTRSLASALAMALCLAVTPLLVFGMVGLLGMPVDVISAPAANVALPLGIDEMIHLGAAVRRVRRRGERSWEAWRAALARMWQPIVFSMAIVASGFALFLLSNFPPTQRLGLLVCMGAVLTDLVVLAVLPAIATIGLPPAARPVANPSRAAA